jgi:hypothetical protein
MLGLSKCPHLVVVNVRGNHRTLVLVGRNSGLAASQANTDYNNNNGSVFFWIK